MRVGTIETGAQQAKRRVRRGRGSNFSAQARQAPPATPSTKEMRSESEGVFDEGSVASGNSREKRVQKVRQRELAKISEGEARQRDSDLHAGNDRAHVR